MPPKSKKSMPPKYRNRNINLGKGVSDGVFYIALNGILDNPYNSSQINNFSVLKRLIIKNKDDIPSFDEFYAEYEKNSTDPCTKHAYIAYCYLAGRLFVHYDKFKNALSKKQQEHEIYLFGPQSIEVVTYDSNIITIGPPNEIYLTVFNIPGFLKEVYDFCILLYKPNDPLRKYKPYIYHDYANSRFGDTNLELLINCKDFNIAPSEEKLKEEEKLRAAEAAGWAAVDEAAAAARAAWLAPWLAAVYARRSDPTLTRQPAAASQPASTRQTAATRQPIVTQPRPPIKPAATGQPISRTIFETQRIQRMVENARLRQNAREEARMAETAAARKSMSRTATHYKITRRK